MEQRTKDAPAAIELPCYEVSGSPREMGASYGAQLRDEIRSFYERRLAAAERYLADWATGGGARRGLDDFLAAGARCYAESIAFDPVGAEEHTAIAEATGLEPERLYAATNMTDIRDVILLSGEPEREGCTSVLLPAPPGARAGLYGQSWDLNPEDVAAVVAINRRPSDGLETWSVTCAGCLSLVAMNAAGVAVGTTNLKTWRSAVGVGYLSVLHKAVQQPSRAAAAEVFATAPVAGAHSYWVGAPDGAEEWERAPGLAERRALDAAPITRSNHCIAPAFQALEGIIPTSSSRARLARASRRAADVQTVEEFRALFADRSDGVDSINRYPEDAMGTATNAVLIAEPAAGILHACRGPADRGRWRSLRFGAQAAEGA